MEIEGGRDHRTDGGMIKGYIDEEKGYLSVKEGNELVMGAV